GIDSSVGDPSRDLFLTWDHARQMLASGMSIGSHTDHHPWLSRLSEADQRSELVESRARIEAELGRSITALASPFGVADAFNITTKRLAREAGYRLAFSLSQRVNRPEATDPFDVHRVAVGSADTFPLFRARLALTTVFGGSFF